MPSPPGMTMAEVTSTRWSRLSRPRSTLSSTAMATAILLTLYASTTSSELVLDGGPQGAARVGDGDERVPDAGGLGRLALVDLRDALARLCRRGGRGLGRLYRRLLRGGNGGGAKGHAGRGRTGKCEGGAAVELGGHGMYLLISGGPGNETRPGQTGLSPDRARQLLDAETIAVHRYAAARSARDRSYHGGTPDPQEDVCPCPHAAGASSQASRPEC